jgi:uncharacterized protein YndB with AHSA1/START domain
MMNQPEDSILAVRRSIHVHASPERVWAEFSTLARMDQWWGMTQLKALKRLAEAGQ